jgi:hypothetical protein
VADLVQDDCQKEAAEEDEALFDLGAQAPVVATVAINVGATRS